MRSKIGRLYMTRNKGYFPKIVYKVKEETKYYPLYIVLYTKSKEIQYNFILLFV